MSFESLCVIGPGQWHDDVRLCGTEAGLRRLRDAIDAALQVGTGVMGAMPDDGEGYWLFVHRLTEEETLRAPHTYLEDYAARDLSDSILTELYERETVAVRPLLPKPASVVP